MPTTGSRTFSSPTCTIAPTSGIAGSRTTTNCTPGDTSEKPSHGLQEAFRCGAATAAHPDAVPGDPEGSDRAALSERVLGQSRGGNLRGRGLGRAALQLTRQVRLGDRLA